MKTRPLLIAWLALATLSPSCQCTEAPAQRGNTATEEAPGAEKGSGTEEGPRPAPARQATTPRPGRRACEVKIDGEGSARVGTEAVGLSVPKGHLGLSVYPWKDGAVLVALKHDWSGSNTDEEPEGKVWEVPCERPADKRVFVEVEGADFGHGAMAHRAGVLYFTSKEGVAALDLESKKWRGVTSPPQLPRSCWKSAAAPRRAMDIVATGKVSGKKLVFHRGGPCGARGAWTLSEHHLIDPLGTKDRRLRRPRPVSAVALDKSGAVWLGDAGRCDVPGVVDTQTPGVVFVSEDQGQKWSQRRVKAKGRDATTAIKTIITDPEEVGSLLVLTARCSTPTGPTGGAVYRSDNAGRSWSRLKLPAQLSEGAHAVDVVGKGLDHLLVWGGSTQRHETKNGGLSWEKLSPGRSPQSQGRLVKNAEWIFRTSSNGLVRKDVKTKRLERCFPPKESAEGSR